MKEALIVVVCLLCSTNASRVQSSGRKQPLVEEMTGSDTLKSIAAFLLASNPGLITPKSNQGVRAMRPMSPIVRTRAPTMSAMDLASECLKDGCSVDSVANLISHLKAIKEPTAEVKNALNELDKLSRYDKPDKNAMETLVGDLFSAFSGFSHESKPASYSQSPKATGGVMWAPARATIDLAGNCLEEGCPVGIVGDLLEQLKAEKNPTAEVLKTIAALEKELAPSSSPPNKNELDNIVGNLVTYFSGVDHGMTLSYSQGPATFSPAPKIWIPSKATVDLAENCLNEGCPVDMVSELLSQLKTEENPSAEVLELMAVLEKLLAPVASGEAPNKNEIEKVVGNLVGSFTGVDAGASMSYSKKP
jgi:hypothetical protein